MTHPHLTGHRPKGSASAGFTLIELMIVVAIVGILLAIALPSYRAYVLRGDRASARAAMLEAQQFMERYYAANNGFTSATLPSRFASVPPESPKYSISLGNLAANTFTLTAAPIGTDALCGSLTLTHTGVKGNGGTGTVADCWR